MLLLTLADEGRLSPLAPYWVCPQNQADRPKSIADIKAGECDYIYLGKGLRDDIPDAGRTVIIYEVDNNHKGEWISVGFADGHVEGVTAKTITEAVHRKRWILPQLEKFTTEQSTDDSTRNDASNKSLQ